MVTRTHARAAGLFAASILLVAGGTAAAQTPQQPAAPPTATSPQPPSAPAGSSTPQPSAPATDAERAAPAAPEGQAAAAAPPTASPDAPGVATASPPTPASADAPPAGGPIPALFHPPVVSAVEGRDLSIEARLDDAHLVRRALLVVRVGEGAPEVVELRRAGEGYGATIPARQVVPGLAYAIELELVDGRTVAVFAARDALHPVALLPEVGDEREARLLARLGGRRSVLGASTEYADFDASGRGDPDYFWRVEGRYTYRLLRTVAEFGVRGGVLRGEADGKSRVGLNYAAPSLRFRLHDVFHLELEGMASISEEGFSTGGGTTVLIGDPYGSKLALGAAFVGIADDRYFGSRFWSRLDLAVHRRVTVAPILEITDMPSAENYGVRLLADVAVDFGGGLSANVQGGYQARIAESGGPSIGGGVALAF